jgi:hypothetical protein
MVEQKTYTKQTVFWATFIVSCLESIAHWSVDENKFTIRPPKKIWDEVIIVALFAMLSTAVADYITGN